MNKAKSNRSEPGQQSFPLCVDAHPKLTRWGAFNIDPRKQEMLPEAQQIVVENFREIEKYLF
jgi:hypothetical protein